MVLFFFFFKQKTAYEMRISDWSSDVCSSDLNGFARSNGGRGPFSLCSASMNGIVFSHDKLVDQFSGTYERWNMRYLYIVLIVLFTAIVLSFKIQNFDSVTLSLWTATLTLPVSVLVIGVYILGMLTGGFLLGLLR